MLHDNENSKISQQINGQIEQEFRTGIAGLDAPTRVLFHQGLESVLKKPLEIRIQWVKRVQTARERKADRKAQGAFQAERKGMARWLHGN